MSGTIEDFLLSCAATDFGKSDLSESESIFYRRFNYEMVSLCKSLPRSAHTDSMLFLLQYAGVRLGDDPDFFANYYRPIWSVLYWIGSAHPLAAARLNEKDLTNAVTGQSMAMFLHSLDDHLTDGQIPVSPLTLLLRSEAWKIMNRALSDLAGTVRGGEGILRSFVDDYYASNQEFNPPESLDEYCDLFRKQMAILMPTPFLLCMKLTEAMDFTKAIELAYGSFGIAWRLLDDIRDIREDFEQGAESAVYLCLPDSLKSHWKNGNVGSQARAKDHADIVLDHILQHGLIDSIKERICAELEAAATIVQAHNLTGLAAEFRCLALPLRTTGATQDGHNG